jgi:hypothetical protein
MVFLQFVSSSGGDSVGSSNSSSSWQLPTLADNFICYQMAGGCKVL